MTVSIVTDSAAALPEDMARSAGISIVPMQVNVGGVSEPSNQVDLAELVQHLEEGVTTSGPSPGDFVHAIEEAPGDEVLVLTIASTMSSTHDAARLAAQAVDKQVVVIDTCTAAGAEGLVVLAAAAAAGDGASLGSVEQVTADAIEQVHLTAFVSSLEQLVRSGRVPAIAGWAGRLIGLHPLFKFHHGEAHRMRPATSRDAAIERILDSWRRTIRPDERLHVAAMHALDPAGADELLVRVSKEVEPTSAFVGEFGAVMVAHTGPGLVGLAWRWESE